MERNYVVVLITAPTPEAGREIARALVEKRLAACVSLLPAVTSLYWWQDSLEEATEVLLLAKTRGDYFEPLKREVTSMHPYQVPEIIALPLVEGLEAYLSWIEDALRREE